MTVGLRYFEALNLPIGLLGDLIAVEIYRSSDDVHVKPTEAEEEAEFFELMKLQ